MLSAATARHSVAASTSSGSSVSCNTNGHTKAEMSMASASSSGNGSPEAAVGEDLPNGVNGGGEQSQDEQKEVDIVINNVVGSFSVKCHLNLRDIALRGHNVEYRRENGVGSTQNYIAHRDRYRLHMVKSAVPSMVYKGHPYKGHCSHFD